MPNQRNVKINESLGNKSRRAIAWDLLGTMLRQVSSLGVSIVLARLLAPEEFGIIGMAMVFVSLTQVFIDVGFTEGLIQKKEVSNLDYSSVFYVNILISLLLCGVIFFSAPLIGHFYDNDSVTSVLVYLSFIPPIAALGRVHSVKLVRNLRFKELTIRDVLATILGGTAGIIAAVNDQGVYSLVWQQMVFVLSGTILLWVGTGWTPDLKWSKTSIQSLLSFSSYVFFDHLLTAFFRKIDTLFIGKVFSAATLGFYSRAESLNAVINNYTSNTISKILFPVFSQIQDDDDRFNAVFTRVITLVVVVTSILAGILYLLADMIIIGLFGDKWAPSIIIFQILVFKAISLPLRSIMFKAMLGKGLARMKFKIGMVDKILMISTIPFGYFFGLEAFVWAIAGSRIAMLVINWILMSKLVKVDVYENLIHFFTPMFILLLYILLYEFLNIDGFFIVVPFLLTQWLVLYLTKNKGYIQLVIESKRYLKVLK